MCVGLTCEQHEFRSDKAGIYSFCFNNEMARFTAKVVRFKVVASAEWGTDAGDEKAGAYWANSEGDQQDLGG